MNSEIHSINTRYNSDFHRTPVNVTTHKNGTYYTGMLAYWYQSFQLSPHTYKKC